jgi:hypothetical protein
MLLLQNVSRLTDRWTAYLCILRRPALLVQDVQTLEVLACQSREPYFLLTMVGEGKRLAGLFRQRH